MSDEQKVAAARRLGVEEWVCSAPMTGTIETGNTVLFAALPKGWKVAYSTRCSLPVTRYFFKGYEPNAKL
jgi:hypothetical protein